MDRTSKENYYLGIADAVLERSTCMRRKYGAIIVRSDEIISTGYNGAPRGRKNCSTPWYVGRYDWDGTAGAHGGKFSNFKEKVIKADKKWLDANGVEFAPLCFAGYSDRNQHPNNRVFKRAGGDFFWSQVHNVVEMGCKMIYVAMFDEIDEGTAIFKCLRQSEVPSNEYWSEYYVIFENGTYRRSTVPVVVSGNGNWCRKASDLNITFTGVEDNLQPDHYLWLAGQAGKMLRKEIPVTTKQPSRQ